MKKILSIVLAVLLVFSLFALAGCGAKELKFGLGVSAKYGKATSADGETNGNTEVTTTVAAVLVDESGKIVKCVIDEAQNKANYTSEGKAVANEELKTKGELGADYGMSKYGTDLNKDGVVKEWNEQIAAFVSNVEGKTLDEVKAMVVDGYGNDDIQTAGCTMAVAPYVTALEKAVANAKASKATSDDTLNLGVVSSEKVADATEDKAGSVEFTTTVTAAVLSKDGKVAVASTDEVATTVSFDTKGVTEVDTSKALTSKYELGANYGMSAYGTDLNKDGVVKEWNEQADAFDSALAGKTADEIAGLEKDGYGVEALQTAGCTIAVSNMIKSAVKAATVK